MPRLPACHRSTPGRFTLLAAAVVVVCTVDSVCAQPLQSRLEMLVRSADIGDAACAFHVVDLTDGLAVAARRADQPMMPASNMKLVTTAAALALLEDDFKFTTRLYHQAGRLYVIGDGDPAFGDPTILDAMSMNIEDLLARWVSVIQRSGIDRFDAIVIDDRVFDRQRVHPNWPADQLNQWYCAEVAGLNFNNNCLDVYATPTDAGVPLIKTRPLDAPVVMTNLARTGRRNAVWATREPGTNRITIRGEVRHQLKAPIHVTVHDPPMFFGRTLRDRLREAGVDVDEVARIGDDTVFDAAEAILLAEVQTPLDEVLARCNQDSQNLFAEALFKRMGHKATGDPGSWSSGAAAVRMFLSKAIGPDAAQIVVDDGSGLSRGNRIAPALLTRLLQRMRLMNDLGPRYLRSIDSTGENGRMDARFNGRRRPDARLLAKSGYIRGVVALSGYLIRDDHAYAFSIMLNDFDKPVYLGKRLLDRMVLTMDEHLGEVSQPADPPTP